MENIDALIEYLINDNPRYHVSEEPETFEDKFRIYRSLVNIRNPNPVDDDYVEMENEMLQELLLKKEITSFEDIETIEVRYPDSNLKHKDILALWQGDICALEIDTIVNAANSQGLGCFIPCHDCIDNKIHTNAGVKLRLECYQEMQKYDYTLPSGTCLFTDAYNLPSKHVIHTVGPVVTGHLTDRKRDDLAKCYRNCLEICIEHGIRSIAFCSISTGVFRFPKDEACRIAVTTVEEVLDENPDAFDKVVFNVFSDEQLAIYEDFIKNRG